MGKKHTRTRIRRLAAGFQSTPPKHINVPGRQHQGPDAALRLGPRNKARRQGMKLKDINYDTTTRTFPASFTRNCSGRSVMI